MSAGLPGLGLGGLFFIASALLAPFGQLWRMGRGRNRPGEWRVVGRQFAQAATMVIAIDLTLRLVYLVLAGVGVGDTPSAVSATVLPLTLIGITSGLLAVVLLLAKLGELRQGLTGDDRPRIPPALPRLYPGRTLAYGTAVAVAWVALLSVGAAELSPLSRPSNHGASPKRSDATVERQPAALPARVQRDLSSPAATDGAHAAGKNASNSHFEGASAGDAMSQPSTPDLSVSQPSVPVPPPSGASAPGGSAQHVTAALPASSPSQAPAVPTSSDPPASAGPPENSPAHEGAGPPEEPGLPEHARPPKGSLGGEHPRSGVP